MQSPHEKRPSAAAKRAAAERTVSVNPLQHEHVPPPLLANLRQYKYSGVDKSVMSNYVMCYWWNFVVTLLPMWLAPNVVTLAGFLISVSSTILIVYFRELDTYVFSGGLGSSHTEAGQYPPWVWYYAAATLFAYQTLDAVDGKQARRTKSGSPLGELFDHGCDAFITPLLQINLCTALGVSGFLRYFVCGVVNSGLLFAIWEQFVTGTLDFGYITGPTEGILITCFIFIMTGLHGVAVWDQPMPMSWSSTHPSFPFELSSWRSLLVVFVVAAGAATILTNVFHVATRSSVHKTRGVACISLLPSVVAFAVFTMYYYRRHDVFDANPFAGEVSFGFLTSYCATRLTVARLCQMPYRPWSPLFLVTLTLIGGLLVFDVAGVNVTAYGAGCVFRALVCAAVVHYLHLIVSIFRQISESLEIQIFKIKSL